MTEHYHIDIFWSEEDDCWIANVPDLEYCSAHGDSPQEAIAEILMAMEAWLEVAREHKDSVPEPSYVSLASHPWLKEASTTR